MKRNPFVVVVVVGTVGLCCGQVWAARGDPLDFQAYVAEVRKAGMTESAKDDLSMVASIRTGGTLLTFQKDKMTGSCDFSYTGTACPVPGADPEAVRQRQTELQHRVERDSEILRKHADVDRSGFVSTAEGREFRNLIEFGYLAAHIVESEGATAADIARAARLATDETVARVAKYNDLARQLNGASEFQVPLVNLTGAESRAARSDPGAR